MLVEFTSGYTGHRVAIDPALVGEVKDLAAELGSKTGRTLLIHRSNRRVHWRVMETYAEVVAAIAAAGVAVKTAAARQDRPETGPAGGQT